MSAKIGAVLLATAALGSAACHGSAPPEATPAEAASPGSVVYVVKTAPRPAVLEAAGIAEPYARATLSTKLMGSVTEVRVKEGDAVVAGEPLLRIDARELAAKSAQADAGIAQAEAMRREAETHATRMRALYAEEAAPKAQLDAAETALARAEAGVRAARASGAELLAVSDYSVVRAPFAGTVTRRSVDPGAFAAPGAALLTVEDGSRLRIAVSAAPDAVRRLGRGDTVRARIEGEPALAVVEGVVPAAGGSLYRVNAVLPNPGGRFLPGSAASLLLPQGTRPTILVPAAAIAREGDLTGVRVRNASGDGVRWVRTGMAAGDSVEVLSGLRDGDQVLIPAAAGGGR
ncbi:MAG TPA: efflux RND transporter periplasmic adaptor subunit [Longimicrobiales bacterium]|nr:efflux RND transporter periplasmic adaptor subunit [Longimicrobiales bacterium]